MKLSITAHAVEQYQSRCDPKANTVQAHAAIKAMGPTLRHVTRAPSGGELYIAADGTRLVLKFDRGRYAVVTVMAPQGVGEWEIPPPPEAPPEPEPDAYAVRQRIAAYLEGRARSGDRLAKRLVLDAQACGVLG